MPEQTSDRPGARKSRSPRYPGISLDVAIQRARALYEQEKRHWAPIDTIQIHWGYKPGTGLAGVSISALKQFGLLEDQGLSGQRRARLTPLALEIILAPGSPDKFVREAALRPEVHSELLEYYGDSLPSDPTLKRHLILERNFTEAGAQEFISQFRKTIAFARLDEISDSAGVSPSGSARAKGSAEAPAISEAQVSGPTHERTASLARSPEQSTFPIPLLGGEVVYLSGHFPLSEAAWNHMLAYLALMKQALVKLEDRVESSSPTIDSQ